MIAAPGREWLIESVAAVACPRSSNEWAAVVSTGPLRLRQEKYRGGSKRSTVQVLAASHGCLIRTRLARPSPLASSRRTDRILVVHSGIRSTSTSTLQTTSIGAPIVVDTS
jgi:hypothetical protein